MIVMRPYPWVFVALFCIVVAFLPALLRRYRRSQWRIPLRHFFVVSFVAALLVSSAFLFVHDVQRQETMLQLWGRAEVGTWDDPAVLATVVHTPASTLLLELVRRSWLPIGVAIALSFAVDRFRHRKRNRGAPVA